jgi:hypothetical protein
VIPACWATRLAARPVVPRQQHRWRRGQSRQRRDRPRGVGTNLICESEHTDRNAVHQDDGGSGAGLKDRRQLRQRRTPVGVGAAYLDEIAPHAGADATARQRAEVLGGRDGDATRPRFLDDGPPQRVLAGLFCGSCQLQQSPAVNNTGAIGVQRFDGGESRATTSQGAGLVQRDDAGAGQVFDDDRGFDQYPVPAGVGDR